MTTILDQLAQYARERMIDEKQKVPQPVLEQLCGELGKGEFSFERALAGEELAFICECKKASPSKGLIALHR